MKHVQATIKANHRKNQGLACSWEKEIPIENTARAKITVKAKRKTLDLN